MYTLGNAMVEHEDMAQGGLCTKEEMDELSQFISYGDFKESTLLWISTGACIHQDVCRADSELPIYNLDQLMDVNG